MYENSFELFPNWNTYTQCQQQKNSKNYYIFDACGEEFDREAANWNKNL